MHFIIKRHTVTLQWFSFSVKPVKRVPLPTFWAYRKILHVCQTVLSMKLCTCHTLIHTYIQNYPQDTGYFPLYCKVHTQCLFNWGLLFQHHIYPIVGPGVEFLLLYFTLWTESSNLYQTLEKKNVHITKSRNASVKNRNTIGAPGVFVLRQFPLYAKRNAWRESGWW